MKKQSQKRYLFDILLTVAFSALISVVVFFYEPIVLYANNMNDFWFDFGTLLGTIIPITLSMIVIITVFYMLIYIVCILCKKPKIYYGIFTVTIFLFVYCYIHGNFLIGSLPALTGVKIEWGGYIVENIISIILAVILLITFIVGIVKLKTGKLFKYSLFAPAIIAFMMIASLSSILFTNDIYGHKGISTFSTNKNLNKISTTKNFYILTLDCTDSAIFNAEVEKKYSREFADFTYFKDGMAGYSLTRDSVPLILTGIWNHNEGKFDEYSSNAYSNSPFLNYLKSDGYDMNIYSTEITWNNADALAISNMSFDTGDWDRVAFIKEELKYVLFKYLPFPLKQYSRIEGMDFKRIINQTHGNIAVFDWDNLNYYNNVIHGQNEEITDALFQYVHIEGSHPPLNMKEDLTIIPDGTGDYESKNHAAAKIAAAAIQRFKDAGVYDNSVIIIMADHGYNYIHGEDGMNPILYIKGISEKHERISVSNKQVSWADLAGCFTELAKGKTAAEAFSSVPDSGRLRYYYYDAFYSNEPMIEWEVDGESYDKNDRRKTGVEYPVPQN